MKDWTCLLDCYPHKKYPLKLVVRTFFFMFNQKKYNYIYMNFVNKSRTKFAFVPRGFILFKNGSLPGAAISMQSSFSLSEPKSDSSW